MTDRMFWAFLRDKCEKLFWDNILEFFLAFVIIFSFSPTKIHFWQQRFCCCWCYRKLCIGWFVELHENTAVLTHTLHATKCLEHFSTFIEFRNRLFKHNNQTVCLNRRNVYVTWAGLFYISIDIWKSLHTWTLFSSSQTSK